MKIFETAGRVTGRVAGLASMTECGRTVVVLCPFAGGLGRSQALAAATSTSMIHFRAIVLRIQSDFRDLQVYHNLMARVAPAVPEDSALLCEKCGYIVDGIPRDSLCPECATPIADSLPQNRQPPLWEREDGPAIRRFAITTAQIIFKPTRFFRSINSRADLQSSHSFASGHYWISSILLGATAYVHGIWAWPWIWYVGGAHPIQTRQVWGILMLTLFSAAAYWLLVITAALAARLTAWEAAYRGLRLPRRVVQRALHYHSAHYLPVALLAFVTVVGHQILIRKFPNLDLYHNATRYLYILCAQVILAAGYLFTTYWTGMRNLMYANG